MPHSAAINQNSSDSLHVSLNSLSLTDSSTEVHKTSIVKRGHSGLNPFEKFLRPALEAAPVVNSSGELNPFKLYSPRNPSVQSIEDLARNTIPRHLSALQRTRRFTLQETDVLFVHARQFQEKWSVSEESFRNWKTLLSGWIEFPAVMLLNPSWGDYLPFQEMVVESTTLSWLQETLAKIQLELDDVIIFDIFPMLRDELLKDVQERMGPAKGKELVRDSFALTKASLSLIRPQILLSCQCCTKSSNEKWGFFDDPLATRLCSSVQASQKGEVRVIEADALRIQVVQGMHPQYVIQYQPSLEKHLVGLFAQVLGPFGTWHSRRMAMHDAAKVLFKLLASLRLQTQLYRRLCQEGAEIGGEQPVTARRLKELEAQLAGWECVFVEESFFPVQ
ncbi:uncharacterized protein PGRI_095800 [Penicillium griseofulvum]|uniref:Uncharacterized protein n=1 Tax=Penicillium patulum TaxID=5078 RepID=A0A135L867_PENPA|nr:uncharacterized protein PGRI_095800 [Penicillium griseofulvum]KXG45149.1 hypothetical protein PGRI_095800 [Penicillium griseofulvum]